MKYNIYSKRTDIYVGDVNLTSSSCKKYKYIGYLGPTPLIYDPKFHYIIPKNKLFDMADSSCSDLSPTQCSAWHKFYDGMNGHKWSECSNNRNNPCDCSNFSNHITCMSASISIIRLRDVTNISGDISSLSSLTKLTSLDLNSANGITGDISSLSSLTNLRFIDLRSAKGISGDISSLSSLTKLTSLDLNSANGITGDISSLSSLTQLTAIALGAATGIRGDISSLSLLTNFRFIDLRSAKGISGDISSLSPIADQLTSGTCVLPQSVSYHGSACFQCNPARVFKA
jgi:hypothetical protein